eukprot:1946253-Rhodomonas_salina.1
MRRVAKIISWTSGQTMMFFQRMGCHAPCSSATFGRMLINAERSGWRCDVHPLSSRWKRRVPLPSRGRAKHHLSTRQATQCARSWRKDRQTDRQTNRHTHAV